MNISATIIAAATIVAGVTGNTVHTSRQLILGGHTAESSQQYVVGLCDSPSQNSFCSGVLITKSHVLTTSTCVDQVWDGISMYAAIGARFNTGLNFSNGMQNGEHIKVETIQIHPEFNNDTTSYDFALLTLRKASQFTPIQQPTADAKPGMYLKAFGSGSPTYPDALLQVVKLEVWSNDRCDDTYEIDDSMICAGGENGKSTCIGDIGGPLVHETKSGDVLIGLVSMAECGNEGTPDVFSRVWSARDWLIECIESDMLL
ncbi:hypothetical protein CCR75_009186 [Bremia lactucae]|uniref:Peptidase S1 domain-containing protein n=1 Tax=Bremia lactucae TaxID=4779 RepID=A0A976IDH1_BRELC|nr:hypothetical protein CCR75_009186 [Bremia lactucae]